MPGLKKLLGYPWIHLEPMRGTIRDNEDYCSKESDLFHLGKPFVQPGSRHDYQDMFERIKNGASDSELAQHNYNIYSHTLRAIDRVRLQNKPIGRCPRNIILLHGAPGCGKTRWCYDQYPDLFELPVDKGMWFDAYQDQQTVLLDEYEGQFPLNCFLKITDPYYVRQVPIKGSFVWWNPLNILLTCNIHPSQWYESWSGRGIKAVAFRRRLTAVYESKNGAIQQVNDINAWFPDPTQVVVQNVGNNYLNNQS